MIILEIYYMSNGLTFKQYFFNDFFGIGANRLEHGAYNISCISLENCVITENLILDKRNNHHPPPPTPPVVCTEPLYVRNAGPN